MMLKRLLFFVFIFFQAAVLFSGNGLAFAEEDADEGSEVEVEDMQSDESAVVGGEDLEDEETESKTLKASPDADTTFLFTQPQGSGQELPAGKDVQFLVGFANRGPVEFTIEALDASFRYPLDFSFHIQNFSTSTYNRVVRPKQDVAFYYTFYTSETYSSRPFGLVVNLYYKDADGHQYLDAVFNETITIVEIEESLDGETFFLYILLAAVAVLLFVGGQQFLVSFTKRKIGSRSKIEMGTQNTNNPNDVDYDWLPKETLHQLNKSPRRSDRLSPRIAGKQSQHQNSQKSPKQSPKQPQQRRAKRGAGGKEE